MWKTHMEWNGDMKWVKIIGKHQDPGSVTETLNTERQQPVTELKGKVIVIEILHTPKPSKPNTRR